MTEQLRRWRELYYTDRQACYSEILAQPDKWALFDALFTLLARDTHEKYKKLGIPEKVYQDTFSDLDIWRGNCKRDFGVNGLAQYGWLEHHINLELFRLGRLQFQPVPHGNEVALNVHVAQGEPLDYDAVRDSYDQAFVFFHGFTNLYCCESWLLAPELREILPETANIIRFQKDYTITEYRPDDRQCEERVFVQLRDNPADYPADTRLQKGVREYLLSGKKVGAASGFFRYRLK